MLNEQNKHEINKTDLKIEKALFDVICLRSLN